MPCTWMTASFTCCIPEREGTGQELGKSAIMACSHHDGMCHAPYQPAIPAAYWSEESLHRAAHWAMLRRLGWSAGCCSVLPSCSKISPSGAKVLPAANRVQSDWVIQPPSHGEGPFCLKPSRISKPIWHRRCMGSHLGMWPTPLSRC